MNKLNLTKRQQEIYNILKNYIQENGYPPTIREMCDLCYLSSTATMYNHLKMLERKGYIYVDRKKNRAISLTEDDYKTRVEKTIKYIKSEKYFDDIEVMRLFDKYDKVLLSYLEGEKNEED